MDLGAAWRLSRLIKQLRPDVVHAHDPHGVAMAALALSMSTQLGQAAAGRGAARRLPHKGNALSRWKYRQVDCFICASDAIRKMLIADGVPAARASPSTKGSTSATSTAAPAADLHAELWLPHHAPIVGNVAALVPHKGQRHLIEAAAIVVKKVPDARFVIAGEGELRERARAADQGTPPREARLPRRLPPRRAVGAQGVRLFVMSSVTEGLGTSLLDAMACGKPIVATTAGGMPEVVADGETGLLVPPRDHEAMAAAIVGLLTDERGAAHDGQPPGWRRVREHFSAERMVQDTLGVYRRVAMHAAQVGQSPLCSAQVLEG